MHHLIYLLGFMGSGKSSLGKKLAHRLDYQFIDLDEEIEKDEDLSISDIFETKGEAYFRRIESKMLTRLVQKKNTVIALGGGTPCSETNIQFILENGLTIYLKVEAAKLIGRLKNKRKNRPLLATLSDDELTAYVHKKIAEREIYYARAEVIYPVKNKNINTLIELIKEKIN